MGHPPQEDKELSTNMSFMVLSELATAACQGQLGKSALPVHLSLLGIRVPSTLKHGC